MEKFRAFLEVLKKFHFWVLCGLILLVSFVSWFLATGELAKQFVTRKGQIENQRGVAVRIVMNSEHPSAKYIQQIRDLESGPLTKQVVDASTLLYREQLNHNVLPKLFANDKEQEEFKKAFEEIRAPMEDIEKLPPSQQLVDFYRSRYRNHIVEDFPKHFDLIERRTVVEDKDVPAANGQPTQKTIGIVDWVNADQKLKSVVARLPNNPTTLDIMIAQEDLWVYQTLLKVIRNTNNVGSDQDHYQKPANHKVARIKQILAMDIGKDAVQSWTQCERVLFNLPAEAGGTGAESHGASPTPTSGAPSDRNSPLVGRYVDDKGKPLSDPSRQPYGEFRMMPINLKVIIEQKEIPRLLAECANSAMRIDVRAVRILVEEPSPVDLIAPDSSSAGGETGTTVTNPAMHIGMGGGDPGGGKEFVYKEESFDPVYQPVPVEVQGVIYIYNPPHVQNPGETAGDKGGQAAPATPKVGTPTAPTAPATSSPPTSTQSSGGRS